VEATSVLLDRLRHGDPAAAEDLFGRLLPVLRKWAAGRLPSHARDLLDTQDLVQDTIVRTLQHLSTFEDRGTGALAAYLRQAIINRIRDETRRAARRGARMALETGVADGGPSPTYRLFAVSVHGGASRSMHLSIPGFTWEHDVSIDPAGTAIAFDHFSHARLAELWVLRRLSHPFD
jgi:DNA-directed RNA polymerase specialized sigma24 family protein